MSLKNQNGGRGGGPWGSGGGGGNNGSGPGGPWGGAGGGRGGGSAGGPRGGPDFEDMIRRGQQNVRRFLPGGFGSGKGIVLIVLLALVIWLATGIYRVDPKERGVEMVFGKMTNVTLQGLHWNWPSPIGNVFKPNVTTENRVDIGFVSSRGGQAGSARQQESQMLTGDENIINVQFSVFWKIKVDTQNSEGIRRFLFNIRNPEKTVKDASESAMREIVGKNEFEYIRTKGRNEIQLEAAKLIQEILNDYEAGIEVIRVQLQQADPPGIVLDAFRDVQAARADKERTVNDANAYLNQTVQQAEGQSEQILRAAEAYRQEQISVAQGSAARFQSLLKQYQASKEVTRQRIYMETMRDVLKNIELLVVDTKGNGTGSVNYLPLNELMKRRTAATGSAN